jgi:hypothetical protein
MAPSAMDLTHSVTVISVSDDEHNSGGGNRVPRQARAAAGARFDLTALTPRAPGAGKRARRGGL